MALYLTVLGSSSATPSLNRHPSAFLLRSDRMRSLMLIDCGEGTQIQLRRYGICMQKISHIFISHLHGDHFFGLVGFLLSQSLLGRKNTLHVYAHSPLKKILKMILDVDKTVLQYPLEFHTIKSGTHVLLEDDKIQVKAFPLMHSLPTHGFLFKEKGYPYLIKKSFLETHDISKQWVERIKNGEAYVDECGKCYPLEEIAEKENNLRSFAYCSDTAYFPELVRKVKNVNMLYHEATFMADLENAANDKKHSTTIQAANIAKAAKADNLLIGHFSARYKDIRPLQEEAQTVFPRTLIALEGVTFKI
ncbi:MAG: ribonuclease Z [Bacteroidales bacterium]|nr:ribonuclease Z [Bacteroidales bacterium]